MAAHRGGIKTVLIPDQNVKDLVDIPDNIKSYLNIRPVKWIDEVLEFALEHVPSSMEGPVAVNEITPAEAASKAVPVTKH